jgi:hypothetical protein
MFIHDQQNAFHMRPQPRRLSGDRSKYFLEHTVGGIQRKQKYTTRICRESEVK